MLGSRKDSGPNEGAPHYLRPRALGDALALRARGAQVIAGGTDFYPARVGKPLYDRDVSCVLDLTGVAGLSGIVAESRHYRIGALTRWTEIVDGDLSAQFRCLQLAAREIGPFSASGLLIPRQRCERAAPRRNQSLRRQRPQVHCPASCAEVCSALAPLPLPTVAGGRSPSRTARSLPGTPRRNWRGGPTGR